MALIEDLPHTADVDRPATFADSDGWDDPVPCITCGVLVHDMRAHFEWHMAVAR